MDNVIAEGAEAKIVKVNDDILKKIRLPKTYRLEIIDKKLRKFRNKREFKVLQKLYRAEVNVPIVYDLIENEDEIAFTFEFLNGDDLKYVIIKDNLFLAFNEIIKMHNNDIVHADLTTLNMILKDNKVYLIDFGLASFSHKSEDKAVDLNIFFNCIKNEHPDFFEYKEELLDVYLNDANNSQKTIKSLENIEKRGRNKK